MFRIFLFTTAFRPALGPTQPPIQWLPEAVFLKVKWPGREADHSPLSSAEVKNAWSYTSTPPIRLYGVVLSLKKYRNNFAFTFPRKTKTDFRLCPQLYKWDINNFNTSLKLKILTYESVQAEALK
jgi:hypothetical protein